LFFGVSLLDGHWENGLESWGGGEKGERGWRRGERVKRNESPSGTRGGRPQGTKERPCTREIGQKGITAGVAEGGSPFMCGLEKKLTV